jgi:dihydrodipicolinate synthase/N-acetylneuraminate lyase
MQLPLRGIIPPLVTPLTPDIRLDVSSLERVIQHVLTGGVHAIFILGTTGEATSLPQDVRRELIQNTVRLVNQRVPVLVGVTDTVQAQALSLARFAADHGADGVVVSTPYYVVPSQSELIAYASAFITGQPLPVILYNIPPLTKASFAPETVRHLAQIPRVIAMKDSSGDLPYFESIRTATERPDFAFLIGNEPLIAAGLERGAHGSIPSGSNLAPKLFVQLHNALTAKSPDAHGLFERIKTLRAFYAHTPGAACVIRTIKGALATLGICSPQVTPPYESCTPAELEQIRRQLRELKLP